MRCIDMCPVANHAGRKVVEINGWSRRLVLPVDNGGQFIATVSFLEDSSIGKYKGISNLTVPESTEAKCDLCNKISSTRKEFRYGGAMAMNDLTCDVLGRGFYASIVVDTKKPTGYVVAMVNDRREIINLQRILTMEQVTALLHRHEEANHDGRTGIANTNCIQCAEISIRACEIQHK